MKLWICDWNGYEVILLHFKDDALTKVETAYDNCNIVLDESDFTDVKFKVKKVVDNNIEDEEE